MSVDNFVRRFNNCIEFFNIFHARFTDSIAVHYHLANQMYNKCELSHDDIITAEASMLFSSDHNTDIARRFMGGARISSD